LSSILDKIRERLSSSEEEPEVEEREPNPFEGEVVASSGLEVGEFVAKVSSERRIDIVNASRGLYRALEDGKVRLIDPSPPRSVFGFFSPVYSIWFWLVVGLVGLLIFSIHLMPQVYPLYYLRIAVAAIFILYVPGYTLIEALYPRTNELSKLERFGFSVGLSIAVIPLVGFALNYTPWGIRLDPALIALSLLTLVLAVLAVNRKYAYWRLARGARLG
jgi:hypothetical protein